MQEERERSSRKRQNKIPERRLDISVFAAKNYGRTHPRTLRRSSLDSPPTRAIRQTEKCESWGRHAHKPVLSPTVICGAMVSCVGWGVRIEGYDDWGGGGAGMQWDKMRRGNNSISDLIIHIFIFTVKHHGSIIATNPYQQHHEISDKQHSFISPTHSP